MDLSLFVFFTLVLHIVLTSVFLRFLWRMKRHESLHNQLIRTQTKKLEQGLLAHQDELMQSSVTIMEKDLRDMTRRLHAAYEDALKSHQDTLRTHLATYEQKLEEHSAAQLLVATESIQAWKQQQIDEYSSRIKDILPQIIGKSIASQITPDQHHTIVLSTLEQAWNNGDLHDR